MANLIALANSLALIVNGSKGCMATIKAWRQIKAKDLSAGNKHRVIRKISTYNVQWGIDRDNKKAVIEARANGNAPATNQGMRGMEWLIPKIVKQSLVNGALHLAVYPAANKTVSQFIENGVDIGHDGYVAATIPSLHTREKRKGLDTFTVPVSGIEWLKVSGKMYRPVDGEFVTAD